MMAAEPQYTSENTFIMVGEETTWGTAVARTITLEAMGDGMVHDQTWGVTQTYRSNKAPRVKFLDIETGSGDIPFEMDYGAALCTLFKHALGKVTTTNPGTLRYQHVIEQTEQIPDPAGAKKGLSIEVPYGGDYSELFSGQKARSFRIDAPPGKIPTVNFSFFGKADGPVICSAESYPTRRIIHHSHYDSSVKLTFNSVVYDVYSWSLEHTAGLAEDRRYYGTTYPAEPVRTSTARTKLRAQVEIETNSTGPADDVLLTAFRAETEAAAQIQFDSGTTYIEATDPWIWLLDIASCYVEAAPHNLGANGLGPLVADVVWDVLDDGTNSPVKITVDNTASSV
jgi:hypothetical protein